MLDTSRMADLALCIFKYMKSAEKPYQSNANMVMIGTRRVRIFHAEERTAELVMLV